jgi:cytochrome P450
MRDPSVALQRARQELGDIFYSDRLNAYVVLSFDLMSKILSDNEAFSSLSRFASGQRIPEKYRDIAPELGFLRELLVISDPPEHTHTRRLMSAQLRPVVVEGLNGGIEEVANSLIDGFIDHGGCELMSEYAYPLTYRTLATLLDLPPSDVPRLSKLAEDLIALIGDMLVPMGEAEFVEAWDRWMDTRHYLESLVRARADDPGDDLISLCARNLGTDGAPTMSKVVTDLCGMIAAGADTTAMTIVHGVALLSSHHEQLAALTRDPRLWQNAVEEVMRRHGSIPAVTRVATRDAEISGVRVLAGDSIVCYLSAGSVDPRHFQDPFKLDVRRANACDQLAFGRGRHTCIGAPLGRLQARIGLQRLFARVPELRPKDGQYLRYRGTIAVPMLQSYSIEWPLL